MNQHGLNIDSSATPCDVESSTTRLDHLVPLRSLSSQFNQHHSRTGKLPILRQTTKGKRLYHVPTLLKLLGVDGREACTQDKQKVQIIYARVSSSHQKTAGDLQRQIDDLRHAYPGHQVLSGVGSGLNYKRKGLQTLLDRVYEGMVEEVVVRHKDRLCRDGLELAEWILEKAGTMLVVLCQSTEQEAEATRELADNLLSIPTVFVARHNGQL